MLAMVLTSVGLPVDGIALVAGVDRIFVLQDGEIRQAGKHEELKDAEGLYAHMWKAYNQSVSWKVGV